MESYKSLCVSSTLIVGNHLELPTPPADGLNREIPRMQDLEAVDTIVGFDDVVLNIAGCTKETIMQHAPIQPDIRYHIPVKTPNGIAYQEV